MENRNGFIVGAQVTLASGTTEREAVVDMIKKVAGQKGESQRITLGADKGYDTQDFVDALKKIKVTPHVAQNDTNRASAIDGRTTRPASGRKRSSAG